MNKKTEKILVGIGLGLLGILGIYKIVKTYKKGMEEMKNQELRETEDLEKAGVNTSKLREEITDDEKDFTKMLFTAVRFNSDIDLDLLDIDLAYEKLDSKVIHVRQRIDTRNRNHESRRRLDFVIDIPDYTGNSYRGPKIGNFLTTFKEAASKMSGEIIRFTPAPIKRLVCMAVVSREKNGKPVIEYRELPQDVYKQYADSEHDGLTKFYEIENPKLNTTGPWDYIQEADWFWNCYPDLKRDDTSILVERLVLQYIISFPIRSSHPDELYGIDTKTGVECIKYLTDELYVGREDSKNRVEYRNLMFNAPNDEGEPDLSWYYTVDEETDKVIIESFDGFED